MTWNGEDGSIAPTIPIHPAQPYCRSWVLPQQSKPSWWSGHSNNFLQDAATVVPGEGILANISFTALARQAHSWSLPQPMLSPLLGTDQLAQFDSSAGERPHRPGRQDRNLHPKVKEAAGKLLASGHPWEAAFAASKALVLHVRERSGKNLEGVALMRSVFSKNNPILRFNAMQGAVDADEQEGMMHLYEGVVMAVRNPGSHAFPTGAEARALQYLDLISMLFERADEATVAA